VLLSQDTVFALVEKGFVPRPDYMELMAQLRPPQSA
jgi:hypothetical protein